MTWIKVIFDGNKSNTLQTHLVSVLLKFDLKYNAPNQPINWKCMNKTCVPRWTFLLLTTHAMGANTTNRIEKQWVSFSFIFASFLRFRSKYCVDTVQCFIIIYHHRNILFRNVSYKMLTYETKQFKSITGTSPQSNSHMRSAPM